METKAEAQAESQTPQYYKLHDTAVKVIGGHYQSSGTLAVSLYCEAEYGEELYTVATTNLESYGLVPTQPDLAFVKDYGENEGIFEWLQKNKIVTEVVDIRVIQYPHSSIAFPLCRFDLSKIDMRN